jgi:NAD(P)-dependent dehydrogenase (short-subunit alcohol dehydrogenase family)
MHQNLVKPKIIVTGCGYKKLEFVFRDFNDRQETHLPIFHSQDEYKLNIGAGTALYLAQKGYQVTMVGRNLEKLNRLRLCLIDQYNINPDNLEIAVVDLGQRLEIRSFLESIGDDCNLHWVNSVGLGAGDIKIKDDNPYLTTELVDENLIKAELSVIEVTFVFAQEFLSKVRKNKNYLKINNKIVIISSMSAIRSVSSAHSAGKGAIDRLANSLMLELWKENTHISTIRPGGIDTGLYDNENVQKEVFRIDKEYGGFWSDQGRLILANPISVAKAIHGVIDTEDFVTSINLVANGQWPNQGS